MHPPLAQIVLTFWSCLEVNQCVYALAHTLLQVPSCEERKESPSSYKGRKGSSSLTAALAPLFTAQPDSRMLWGKPWLRVSTWSANPCCSKNGAAATQLIPLGSSSLPKCRVCVDSCWHCTAPGGVAAHACYGSLLRDTLWVQWGEVLQEAV